MAGPSVRVYWPASASASGANTMQPLSAVAINVSRQCDQRQQQDFMVLGHDGSLTPGSSEVQHVLWARGDDCPALTAQRVKNLRPQEHRPLLLLGGLAHVPIPSAALGVAAVPLWGIGMDGVQIPLDIVCYDPSSWQLHLPGPSTPDSCQYGVSSIFMPVRSANMPRHGVGPMSLPTWGVIPELITSEFLWLCLCWPLSLNSPLAFYIPSLPAQAAGVQLLPMCQMGTGPSG